MIKQGTVKIAKYDKPHNLFSFDLKTKKVNPDLASGGCKAFIFRDVRNQRTKKQAFSVSPPAKGLRLGEWQ